MKTLKENVTGQKYDEPLSSIECQIMDIADDIAYSTFDLEDSFKANFLSSLDFLAVKEPILNKVHEKVTNNKELQSLEVNDIQEILSSFISAYLKKENFSDLSGKDLNESNYLLAATGLFYSHSKVLNNIGYERYAFTSALIDEFIAGVNVKIKNPPVLSEIHINKDVKAKIECLKHFVFYSITMSSRLRLPEYRGYQIVSSIINKLSEENHNSGKEILPKDVRRLYEQDISIAHRKRTICDFVAGMTDRYVIEFYGRLKSENPQTIFKPI